MFHFITRFFSRRKKNNLLPADFSASVNELWSTDFAKPENRRFIEETGDGYRSFFCGGLTLELQRKSLFAWTVNPQYQYRNFILESVVDFAEIQNDGARTQTTPAMQNAAETAEQAGTCACGFLLRYINETNYYSLLVSDGGFFRFDAVFNGNQIPLTGWVPFPQPDAAQGNTADLRRKKLRAGQVPVQIIANGTGFAIIIDYQLAAAVNDDIIQSEGSVAFAAQNWNIWETARVSLRFFSIDSREVQTDAAFRQWNADSSFSAAQRIQFAKSLAAAGRILPAISELKKSWNNSVPRIDDLLFGARLYMTQNLYNEAAELLEQAEKAAGTDEIACARVTEQKASLLYLQGDYRLLETLLDANPALMENGSGTSALLCSLKAHVLASRGQYKDAAHLYEHAALGDPEQGQHLSNAADMYLHLKQSDKAFDLREKAAGIFLSHGQFQDFEAQLELLSAAINQPLSAEATEQQNTARTELKARVVFLEAQYAFVREDLAAAQEKLDRYMQLTAEGQTVQPDAWYLRSEILRRNGDIEGAADSCKNAVRLKADEALYHRTLAELFFMLDKTEQAQEEIQSACALSPNDGAAWNLAASLALRRGDLPNAEKAVFTALACMPEELPVLKNYALILQRMDRFDEALPVLDEAAAHSGFGTAYRAQVLRTAANILRDAERFEEAESRYQKARELSPQDPQLAADYAALCVSLGKLNEADSILSRHCTQDPPPDVYRILACIAAKKGDYPRAQIILRQTLEFSRLSNSERANLLLDLANLYLLTNKPELAEETAQELSAIEVSPRVSALLESLEGRTRRKISCGKCGRIWFVPARLPAQNVVRLTAEPPDDMPAGNCPDCGSIYCIGCAKETLDEAGHFGCLKCGTRLKLQDKGVIWLLRGWNETQTKHS
ncbi:MAG: tetratricopeptide repeat protein [Bacteroides sp.]|nr:tetratricopeptide repeat protein [Prevotella sp.]MCM1408607.1 tetratricopeptide repeat protein [Treponema brennaborense]MCM1468905.1 tetratricopeptide repeat protein [Bacteroides sp.]